ncbi:acetyltransferase [Candidatus Peregrinibacteria bacterium]|nr:acetyltransferase [Candidatus Peregrinibacteria bacterium]
MKDIFIFGAGGHGKVILDILMECDLKIQGFIDENPEKVGQTVSGYPILGGWEVLEKSKNAALSLGIGNNIMREKTFAKAQSLGCDILSAIHPRATISRDTKIGEGSVIMANAVINPGVIMEEGVVVNTGATVDHDCFLKRFCHVHPGGNLAGRVILGEFSYVGTGTAIIQTLTIGKNVIIGAGAAVVKDLPDNVTAVGVPAKIIKHHTV